MEHVGSILVRLFGPKFDALTEEYFEAIARESAQNAPGSTQILGDQPAGRVGERSVGGNVETRNGGSA